VSQIAIAARQLHLHIASLSATVTSRQDTPNILYNNKLGAFLPCIIWFGPLFAIFFNEMRIAISTWSGMISPLFDVAQRLLLVDIEAGREISRREEPLNETHIAGRAMHITRLGVDVLICGAISRPLEMMLASEGMQVIPHTCGLVEEVIRAYASGQLTEQAYLMPGCCGHGRRMRARGGRGGRGGRGFGGGRNVR